MSTSAAESSPPAPPPAKRAWEHPSVAIAAALGGIVLGGVLTGAFSLGNTYAQQAGTTEESLRTQRQTAYTEFLTQHGLFQQASQDHILVVLKSQPNDVADVEKSYAEVDDTYKNLTAAVSAVDIVGTSDVAVYAERLYSADNSVHSASFGLQTVATKPELRSGLDVMANAVSKALDAKDLQDSYVAFTTRARDDVISD